jgi:hypothetical protein
VKKSSSGRLRRGSLLAVLLVPAFVAIAWVPATTAGATPGEDQGNFTVFYPDHATTTNGSLCMYETWSLIVCAQAGSGTSTAANNSACNKYWGGSDSNGGGRSPNYWYTSDESPYFYGWDYTYAPYNSGMAMTNGIAYGSSFDCAGSGQVTRTELWVTAAERHTSARDASRSMAPSSTGSITVGTTSGTDTTALPPAGG